jgi:phosphomethylpyrimidine synthase
MSTPHDPFFLVADRPARAEAHPSAPAGAGPSCGPAEAGVRQAWPASRKVRVQGGQPGVSVPMREISLTNGEKITVYDTSGPYTDPTALIDPRRGLETVRSRWIAARGDTEPYAGRAAGPRGGAHGLARTPRRALPGGNVTQLHYARRGIVTPEMEFVALRENGRHEWMAEYLSDAGREARLRGDGRGAVLPARVTPEFVRDEVARGRAVIPANINHPELEPMAIGRNFLVKVGAGLGGAAAAAGLEDEVDRLVWATRWGADTVMDLSAGARAHAARDGVVRNSPVPVGTVPIHQALEKVGGVAEELGWPLYRDTLVEQAEQGIDCFVVHAGLRADIAALAAGRRAGIVSRGGAALARWCAAHGRENFLFAHFEEICEIAKAYDVSLALGGGLRPGAQADAGDAAQRAELRALGELADAARAHDVQTLVDGPGHVPMHLIAAAMEEHLRLCGEAPAYAIGPSTVDIAPGHEHVAGAIGAAMAGWAGTSMLCCAASQANFGTNGREDVKRSLVACKIAAHAADLAKGHPGARARDDAMGKAQAERRWQDRANLALDPDTACRARGADAPAAQDARPRGPDAHSTTAPPAVRDAAGRGSAQLVAHAAAAAGATLRGGLGKPFVPIYDREGD